MPADRHDDRQDASRTTEAAMTQPRRHHVRESVSHNVSQMRAEAARGAAGAGSGAAIDACMDRMVSEQANHTQDAPGRASDGDGHTNDRLRAVLEGHRREMELAAVTTADMEQKRGSDHAPSADRPVDPERLPPREPALRDPANPRSPGRPSITTMAPQKHSYGPQNFARTDVIDRPLSMPVIARGGPGAPVAPTAPPRALGTAAAQDRSRTGPARSI